LQHVANKLAVAIPAESPSDKIDFRVTPGLKHAGYAAAEITGMLDWFDKYLKPAAAASN